MNTQDIFLEEDFKHYLNSVHNLVNLNKDKSVDYIRKELERINCDSVLINILLNKRK